MAVRYYCPQWCHTAKGWIDLPTLASKDKKPADDAAVEFAERNKVTTRVIRKPKGWDPEFPIDYSAEAKRFWKSDA